MKDDPIAEKSVPKIDPNSPLKIDENPTQIQNETSLDRTNKELFISGVIFCFVILVIIVLISAFRYQMGKTQQANKTEVKISQTEPTISPTFNKSDFVFEVLNGTGKTGEAKKAADVLQSLGFTVVKTGNTEKSQTTNINLDDKLLPQSNELLDILKNDFKVASVTGNLKTDTTASAQLVIGLQ